MIKFLKYKTQKGYFTISMHHKVSQYLPKEFEKSAMELSTIVGPSNYKNFKI